MGLFFEVRFDFVALGRSRETGSGLQSQSPWVFLLIPTLRKGLCAFNWAPAELASFFSPRCVQAVSLNLSVATKRATRKNKILQSPTKSREFFDRPSASLRISLLHTIQRHACHF
jgi:hypothetical protein